VRALGAVMAARGVAAGERGERGDSMSLLNRAPGGPRFAPAGIVNVFRWLCLVSTFSNQCPRSDCSAKYPSP
jgi:hypothetical protein